MIRYYSFVLGAMCLFAVIGSTRKPLAVVGAILFVLSDLAIALDKFSQADEGAAAGGGGDVTLAPRGFQNTAVIMVTYYIAQYLLVTGLA